MQLLKSLGSVSAIIGAQWGDEGKGKATDILAEHFDVLARACGGANAGHTIVVNGEKHVFHLIPSGCLHEGKPIILGAGLVIHLPTLLEEIQLLRDAGVDIVPRLYISHAAQIVLEYHKEIDGVLEEKRAKLKGKGIGTTKRGIGPAYMDKAERCGLRVEVLQGSEQDMKALLEEQEQRIRDRFGITVNVEQELASLVSAKKQIESTIKNNIPELLHAFVAGGKTVLIEGAQATLLDVDHGTYPYVTSSSTTLAGALQGLGLAPDKVNSCIGIAKAYCTRFGEGDFLTEANEEDGQRLRDRGGEYGATTGRPRRCGWLYIPDLVYCSMINGFTHWNITKLDVLDEEESIPVGVGEENGEVIYENLPGWKESTVGITEFSDLPENAQKYLLFIEDKTGVPVALVGTGQGREEMIVRS